MILLKVPVQPASRRVIYNENAYSPNTLRAASPRSGKNYKLFTLKVHVMIVENANLISFNLYINSDWLTK